MAELEAADATYHVLLIGVDDYPGHALKGCVNDIDAVQRVLLGPQLRIPSERIRRLASPLPGTTHETTIAEQPATYANIHAALSELGSERVRPGDRVIIYYSGHGKRVVVMGLDGPTFQREALVPVDFAATPGSDGFLYDFELNGLLAAIARRTSSVVVMLDCCHAAGTTRAGAVRSFDRGARDREPIADPARARSATRGEPAGDEAAGVTTCQIVSACLANEFSLENDHDGVHNGVFTSALVAAVRGTGADLRTLTWDRIWYAMLSEVAQRHLGQHPRMDGGLQRRVFGGPPVDADAGLW